MKSNPWNGRPGATNPAEGGVVPVPPEAEADGVGGGVFGELEGGFEDADCAGAVVVDPGAGLDAVEMGT